MALAVFLLLPALAMAQNTPGGTIISNQVSAAYQDDAATNYNSVSNTVTVTVANVSGLAITPDGTSISTVVPGQTGVQFPFTLTNTSNNAAKIHFLAGGASIQTTRGTVTAAFVDYNGNGTFDSGTDLDIFGNGAAVDTSSIAKDGTVNVVVVVTVSSSATAAQTVTVQLGDAGGSSPYDGQPSDSSANEVRTDSTGISPAPVNGESEARGTVNATVENDALIRLSLTRTAGPVAIGSDITYGWVLTNDGTRAASAQTLTVDAAPVTGIFIVAPIPARTVLKSGQTFPAGTIYTTTPITTAPLSATWSATAPADLNNLTRIGFNIGNSLAIGASTANIPMLVTVKSGISILLPIRELGDAFSKNSLPTPASITDQSHDAVANAGDGNADFTQGDAIGSVDGDGVMLDTTLSGTGSVLLGPSGFPGAFGSGTDTSNDYTNRSVNTGIATVAPGGNTTALGTAVFTNSVQNTGNANDTYTFTAPTIPTGFTVEVSVNGLGTDYVDITTSPTLAVAYNTTATILVRVTAPAGNVVLTAYPTLVRATSLNTPAANNDTIDRLYTGFISLVKTAVVANGTGRGGATDPVPGAVITYSVAYANLASTGGTNCVTLNASNLVITEDGTAGSNNWGTYTSHVVNSATDSRSGTITGNAVTTSTVLTDTLASLPAGQSGTFSFQRLIK
jgi:hypothetical protein